MSSETGSARPNTASLPASLPCLRSSHIQPVANPLLGYCESQAMPTYVFLLFWSGLSIQWRHAAMSCCCISKVASLFMLPLPAIRLWLIQIEVGTCRYIVLSASLSPPAASSSEVEQPPKVSYQVPSLPAAFKKLSTASNGSQCFQTSKLSKITSGSKSAIVVKIFGFFRSLVVMQETNWDRKKKKNHPPISMCVCSALDNHYQIQFLVFWAQFQFYIILMAKNCLTLQKFRNFFSCN